MNTWRTWLEVSFGEWWIDNLVIPWTLVAEPSCSCPVSWTLLEGPLP